MWRCAVMSLSACLVACCGGHGATGGGKVTMFTRAWTFDHDAPYHPGVLPRATLGATTSLVDGYVVTTATGALAWTPRGVVAGLDGGHAIETVVVDDRITGLRIADAATGATVAEVALVDAAGQPSALRVVNAGLTVEGGTFIYSHLSRAQGFDLATGRERWNVMVPEADVTVLGSGALVGLADGIPARGLIVVDAATGQERWRTAIDGASPDGAASPRGGFFVPRGGQVVELGADGREVRAVRGDFGAADGEFLAVRAGDDIVVVDGGGAEVDRVKPAGAGDFVAAPGLCGRALVYFRNRDATVWWRPAGGRELPIVKLEPKSGTVDGQPRTAQPTLTVAPRCVAGLVLIQDWTITAYRIPTP